MFARKKTSTRQRIRQRRSLKKELGRALQMESLSKRELMAADLSLVDAGLADVEFGEIQQSINARIEQAPAPFIGDALATDLGSPNDKSSQFVSRIDERTEAFVLADNSAASIASVEAAIRTAFEGFAEVEIEVAGQDGDSDIRFDVTLSGARSYSQGVTLELVGADPEIDLRAGGEDQVELDLNWSYKLTFGVRELSDGSSQFYHDVSGSNEVKIDFAATMKNDFDGGRGKVGVFFGEIGADQDDPAQISRFVGRYVLDIAQNGSGETTVAGTLTGVGEANLDVRGSFNPNYEANEDERLIDVAVTADGKVTYRTHITFEVDGDVDWTQNHVEVHMDDVSVDLGKIYTDFVDPIVSDLQNSLKPLKPMVEFLNKPLPVISDVYELAGKGSVTALTLAGYGADHPLVRTLNTIGAILNYRGLSDADSEDSETLLSYSLSKSGVDSKTAERQRADRESRLEYFRENGLKIELADKHKNPEEHAEWERSLAWSSEFDGSIDLPFLTDSDTLVGFLLGDTQSEFFTFELDGNFSMDLSVNVPIVPLANLASLVGGLEVTFTVDLDGGYDATGISQLSEAADYSSRSSLDASVAASRGMLWNGFYLDDHNSGGRDNVRSQDAPEATLEVSVGADLQAGLDIIVASLTFDGGAILETYLEFDLNDLPEPAAIDSRGAPIWSNITPTNASDWEYDGRIRFQEMKTIVDANPGALFNVSGVLQAGMDASVEAKVLGFTVYSNTWELFRVTLIDEKLSEPDDAKTIFGEDPPQLASLNSDGELSLFVGDRASLRNRDSHVRDEVYSVQSLGESRDGGETVLVTFESNGETYTQYFHGVTSVTADAGSGNDEITVLPGTNINVNLLGGTGKDTLLAMGGGVATLLGDDGDDRLVGGSANDLLIGGLGNDEIRAGAGNDVVYGNQGDDKLFGDGGHDFLDGADGGDDLDGGVGNDVLYGRAGGDVLLGSAGDDTLWGGEDNDQLRGGLGSDLVYGEGGQDRIQFSFLLNENSDTNHDSHNVDDQIFGGAGLDTIEIVGSDAADRIHLQQSGATIHITGSTYSDELEAFEQVSDFKLTLPESIEDRDVEQLQVRGGKGDDQITAHGWFNVNELGLFGEEGDDTIQGANSRNVIDGGDGHDTLIGGRDRDLIRGGWGDDIIAAGGGHDAVYGDDGNDNITGGSGSDNLSGGAGDDTIYADGSQNADASVGGGDALMGGEGHDRLFGSLGDDDLFGGEGDDYIDGSAGDDTLHGDNGNDRLIGALGHDRLFGGEGDDYLFAQFDEPIIGQLVESTDEYLEPVNRLFGGGGNDVLRGSQHFDRLAGEAGNDIFEHTSGGDLVFGGEGDDDRYIVFGTQGDDAIALGFLEDAFGGTPMVLVQVNDADPIIASQLEVERVGAHGLGGNDSFAMQFGDNAALPVVLRGGEGDDTFHVEHFQGELEVRGGQGNDAITAQLTSAQLADGTFADRRMVLADNALTTDHLAYQLSSVELAELTGNAADNTLDAGDFSGSVALVGLDGDDRLVSAGGDDRIDGGAGIDTLIAEADADFVLQHSSLSGKGRDSLESMERAELIGGASNNRLDASASRFDTVTLRGGAGDDTLIGGSGADHLYGDAGQDSIDGTIGGVDFLYGGDGDDVITGADDNAYGEGGNDTIRTASSLVANRIVKGGAGNDSLFGSNLDDKLEGGDGNDRLHGYAGNDRLEGGSGSDFLYGHEGNDYMVGGSGNDRIYGHQGNDRLYGGSGNDHLYGHDGSDRLYGESGSDYLWGANGNDYLDGGRDGRADRLYGGNGRDTAVQYRYWRTTFLWIGYWVNQEKIYSTEQYVYRRW